MTISTPLETVRRYLAGEITERQACDWFDCDRLAFREEIDALVAAVNASYLTTPSRAALDSTTAPLDVDPGIAAIAGHVCGQCGRRSKRATPAPLDDPVIAAMRPARRGGYRRLTFDNGRYETYDCVFIQHPGGEWDRILIARDDGTIATALAALINATPAPLDVEWYIEHRVHPSQQGWDSMRVADEVEGRDWLARWEADPSVIAARLICKTVVIVAAYAEESQP